MIREKSEKKDLILKILELYGEIDKKVEEFKSRTALECPASCGACCEKEDLEMTVLDFLPLAAYLWKTKKAEGVLEILDKKPEGPCVFYRSNSDIKGNGRCSVYPLRGLICRLFGFSAMKDKNDVPRLCTCPIIKKDFHDEFKKAERSISSGLYVPIIRAFSMRLMCLDASLGVKLFPVNKAIKIAIERIGFNPETLTEIERIKFPGVDKQIALE